MRSNRDVSTSIPAPDGASFVKPGCVNSDFTLLRFLLSL